MIYYIHNNKQYELIAAIRMFMDIYPQGYGRRLMTSRYLRGILPVSGDFHRGLGYHDLVSLR